MALMDGVEATREIRSRYDDVEVVVLTSFVEEERVHAALEAGASGYLLKDADVDEVVQRDPRRPPRRGPPGRRGRETAHGLAARTQARIRWPELTEREREILRMVAAGKANKQIAAELVISERTARTHVSNILRKLDLASRTQAALWAVREGLADADPATDAPRPRTNDVGRPAAHVSRKSSPAPESAPTPDQGTILQTSCSRRPPTEDEATLIPIKRGVTIDTRDKGRDFGYLLASSALVIVVVVIIWAVTGAGSFWPIWIVFGLGVVLLEAACAPSRPQHAGKAQTLPADSVAIDNEGNVVAIESTRL